MVASSPSGPGFGAAQDAGRFDDVGGEQAADLVAGQRDQAVRRCLDAFDVGQDGEQGVGEHREQGPAPPRCPAADLVFVEAGQSLAGLEGLLDPPAVSSDPDQLGQRDRRGGIAAVERQLTAAGVAPYEQPPAARAGLLSGGAADRWMQGDQRPVVAAVSLRAGAGRELLPGSLRHSGAECVGAHRPGGGGDGRSQPIAST